jgi:orotate phosphoribosyltransferase
MNTRSLDPRRPLAQLLVDTKAVLTGHFLLSSGLHSDRYVQCALLLQHPQLAERVGQDLAACLQAAGLAADAVVGPALGGVVVAHEVARALGTRALFAEREGGGLALRRSFAITPGERVVIAEDVITTGRSARETALLCQAAGGVVVAYVAVVERGEEHGLAPLFSLWQVRPQTFTAGDCPLCAAGSAPSKPGSRPLAGAGAFAP